MASPFEIAFNCLPLRSMARWDVPHDASPDYRAFCERVKQAAEKHGQHNSYFLYNGRCVFHLTNDPAVGMPAFGFEGTALTDMEDGRPVATDLRILLTHETCDWLVLEAISWLRDTVQRAILVEFERYIAASDRERTCDRIQRIESDVIRNGGFVGMGL